MRLPDRETLIQHLPPAWILHEISNQYLLDPAGLHGLNHWGRVFENGIALSLQQGGDQQVISLLSVFHDACRINQSVDPGHGGRAADFAVELLGANQLLSPTQMDQLLYACRLHTAGRTKADLTVQICWDSDRLDLYRAGIYPEGKYLCTAAAKDDKFIRWAANRSSTGQVSGFVNEIWKPVFS